MDILFYVWIGILIGSIVIEAVTYGLVTIWFIPAAVIALILNVLHVHIAIQIAVFAVISLVLLIFCRKFFLRFVRVRNNKTNTDLIIGQTGVVTEEIDNLKCQGSVKVQFQHWTARSEDDSVIPADSLVEILRIDGVKLIVKKKQ